MTMTTRAVPALAMLLFAGCTSVTTARVPGRGASRQELFALTGDLKQPYQELVLVRRPGTRRFRKLSDATLLPSGTVVDARRGRISLTTALGEEGQFQTGRFWGSRFEIRQGSGAQRHDVAEAARRRLRPLSGARERRAARHRQRRRREPDDAARRAQPVGPRPRRPLPHPRQRQRRHRARDRLVHPDRCSGTYTRVIEGAVSVRDLTRHKRVLVKAGHLYLARAHVARPWDGCGCSSPPASWRRDSPSRRTSRGARRAGELLDRRALPGPRRGRAFGHRGRSRSTTSRSPT